MPINLDHTTATFSTDAGPLTIGIDSAIGLPVGAQAQRPSPALAGHLRFDSDTGRFEGYDGSSWGSIAVDISTTDDVPEGSNLYYTDERVDDRVNDLLQSGTGITLTYDDGAGTLTIDSSSAIAVQDEGTPVTSATTLNFAGLGVAAVDSGSGVVTVTVSGAGIGNTDDVPEGTTNLYYTNERVDDRVAALLQQGSNITLTYDDALNTLTIDAANAPVDSVNGQTGIVVLDPDDLDDSSTTNKFTTAGDISKLAGIESGATADQTGAEIKALYEAEPDTNAYDDAAVTKLAGIEANATADQTAGEILAALLTVDGAASGLDADLLDGEQGSFYLDYNNFTNTPTLYTSSDFDTDFAGKSTTDLAEGTNLYYTDERVDDRVNALLIPGTNISITYDDGANTLTIDAAAAGGFDLSNNNLVDIGDVSAVGLSDADILIYDTGTSTWRPFSLSGDATMNDSGVVTVSNAATADALTTLRTIGGVGFDGTANIDLPGVNIAGNQDTSGNAATATALETARNISLGGDLSGSASFDGTANITITATIQPDSVALGTDTVGNYVATIAGTANEIEVTGSGSETAAVTVGLPNDVTISNDLTVAGNLTVNGTTTTVNTETIELADNIIVFNSNEAGVPSQDAGIEIERGTSANKTLLWDETLDQWTVGAEDFVANNFIGNLTGNATTATALETGRTFSLTGDVTGVSAAFDGSGNISISTTIAPDSVTLGTDTTGNYVATISGTANEIEVSGSGSETSAVTIGLPADVTVSNTLTVGSSILKDSTTPVPGLTVAETPPGSPAAGDLWFDSDDATLYLYYTDVDSSQWVGISGPSSGTGGSGASPFIDTGTFVYYGGPRNVGIGTATPSEALEVVGDILASGDVTAFSDQRLKEDIETYSDALNTVKQMRGVRFRRKSDQATSVGLVAQEVQSVLPEVVHGNADTGYLSVAYGNVVGVLVEAVKEQQIKIDSQEDRISRLEEIIDKLMEK